MHKRQILNLGSLVIVALVLATYIEQSEAGQGCPFDDGSCQDYCAQQGCNMGYCGHFAWIQCICRKCGSEWNWYDKVKYKPDEKVNQTELDSLQLNSSSPIILTNSSSSSQLELGSSPSSPQSAGVKGNQQMKQPATLTTLLIPDLSESNGKLDLNDIPDENSEKFLDYLAKNHERLVQATNAEQAKQSADSQGSNEDDEANLGETTEETVEIQISSNNSTSTADEMTQPNPESQTDESHHEPLMKLLRISPADIK